MLASLISIVGDTGCFVGGDEASRTFCISDPWLVECKSGPSPGAAGSVAETATNPGSAGAQGATPPADDVAAATITLVGNGKIVVIDRESLVLKFGAAGADGSVVSFVVPEELASTPNVVDVWVSDWRLGHVKCGTLHVLARTEVEHARLLPRVVTAGVSHEVEVLHSRPHLSAALSSALARLGTNVELRIGDQIARLENPRGSVAAEATRDGVRLGVRAGRFTVPPLSPGIHDAALTIGAPGGTDAPVELAKALWVPDPAVLQHAILRTSRLQPTHAPRVLLELELINGESAAALDAAAAAGNGVLVGLTGTDERDSEPIWMRSSVVHAGEESGDEEVDAAAGAATLNSRRLRAECPQLLARSQESFAVCVAFDSSAPTVYSTLSSLGVITLFSASGLAQATVQPLCAPLVGGTIVRVTEAADASGQVTVVSECGEPLTVVFVDRKTGDIRGKADVSTADKELSFRVPSQMSAVGTLLRLRSGHQDLADFRDQFNFYEPPRLASATPTVVDADGSTEVTLEFASDVPPVDPSLLRAQVVAVTLPGVSDLRSAKAELVAADVKILGGGEGEAVRATSVRSARLYAVERKYGDRLAAFDAAVATLGLSPQLSHRARQRICREQAAAEKQVLHETPAGVRLLMPACSFSETATAETGWRRGWGLSLRVSFNGDNYHTLDGFCATPCRSPTVSIVRPSGVPSGVATSRIVFDGCNFVRSSQPLKGLLRRRILVGSASSMQGGKGSHTTGILQEPLVAGAVIDGSDEVSDGKGVEDTSVTDAPAEEVSAVSGAPTDRPPEALNDGDIVFDIQAISATSGEAEAVEIPVKGEYDLLVSLNGLQWKSTSCQLTVYEPPILKSISRKVVAVGDVGDLVLVGEGFIAYENSTTPNVDGDEQTRSGESVPLSAAEVELCGGLLVAFQAEDTEVGQILLRAHLDERGNVVCSLPKVQKPCRMKVSVAPNGTDFVGSAELTYFQPPLVLGVSPTVCAALGNTPVVINLSAPAPLDAAQVRFSVGGWSATVQAVASERSLSCLSPMIPYDPANPTAEVGLEISYDGVLFSTCTQTLFAGKLPEANNVQPEIVNCRGGVPAVISGKYFIESDKVSVRFATIPEGETAAHDDVLDNVGDLPRVHTVVEGVEVSDSEHISLVLPDFGASGAALYRVEVSVNGVDFSRSGAILLAVYSPILDSLSPATAALDGAKGLTGVGRNLLSWPRHPTLALDVDGADDVVCFSEAGITVANELEQYAKQNEMIRAAGDEEVVLRREHSLDEPASLGRVQARLVTCRDRLFRETARRVADAIISATSRTEVTVNVPPIPTGAPGSAGLLVVDAPGASGGTYKPSSISIEYVAVPHVASIDASGASAAAGTVLKLFGRNLRGSETPNPTHLRFVKKTKSKAALNRRVAYTATLREVSRGDDGDTADLAVSGFKFEGEMSVEVSPSGADDDFRDEHLRFTAFGHPVIQRIFTESGPPEGGTPINLGGRGFSGCCVTVRFGFSAYRFDGDEGDDDATTDAIATHATGDDGTPLADVDVVAEHIDDEELMVRSPKCATMRSGRVPLLVSWNSRDFTQIHLMSSQENSKSTVPPAAFHYMLRPHIQRISPVFGSWAGGSHVSVFADHVRGTSNQVVVRFEAPDGQHWVVPGIVGGLEADKVRAKYDEEVRLLRARGEGLKDELALEIIASEIRVVESKRDVAVSEIARGQTDNVMCVTPMFVRDTKDLGEGGINMSIAISLNGGADWSTSAGAVGTYHAHVPPKVKKLQLSSAVDKLTMTGVFPKTLPDGARPHVRLLCTAMGETRVPATLIDETRLECAWPHATLSGSTAISLSLNGEDYTACEFAVIAPAPMRLCRLHPQFGPSSGGVTIAVDGLGFNTGEIVKLSLVFDADDDKSLLHVTATAISGTRLAFEMPPLPATLARAGGLAVAKVMYQPDNSMRLPRIINFSHSTAIPTKQTPRARKQVFKIAASVALKNSSFGDQGKSAPAPAETNSAGATTGNPVLQELLTITSEEVAAVASVKKPDEDTIKILGAVMVLLNKKPTWSEAKRMLRAPGFVNRCYELSIEDIPKLSISAVRRLVRQYDLTSAVSSSQYRLLQVIGRWALFVVETARRARKVEKMMAKASRFFEAAEASGRTASALQQTGRNIQDADNPELLAAIEAADVAVTRQPPITGYVNTALALRFRESPSIASVSPSSCSRVRTTQVCVTGTRLELHENEQVTVFFSDVNADVSEKCEGVVVGGMVVTSVPPIPEGVAELQLTVSLNATDEFLDGTLKVVGVNEATESIAVGPQLLSLSRASGPSSGSPWVKIEGYNFKESVPVRLCLRFPGQVDVHVDTVYKDATTLRFKPPKVSLETTSTARLWFSTGEPGGSLRPSSLQYTCVVSARIVSVQPSVFNPAHECILSFEGTNMKNLEYAVQAAGKSESRVAEQSATEDLKHTEAAGGAGGPSEVSVTVAVRDPASTSHVETTTTEGLNEEGIEDSKAPELLCVFENVAHGVQVSMPALVIDGTIRCRSPAVPSAVNLPMIMSVKVVSPFELEPVNGVVKLECLSSPKLLSLMPTMGPHTGGTVVTIEASDVGSGKLTARLSSVDKLWEVDVPASVVDTGGIQFRTPKIPVEHSVVCVRVAQNGLLGNDPGLPFLSYPPAFVASVLPTFGPARGGTTIRLQGSGLVGFSRGAVVTIDDGVGNVKRATARSSSAAIIDDAFSTLERSMIKYRKALARDARLGDVAGRLRDGEMADKTAKKVTHTGSAALLTGASAFGGRKMAHLRVAGKIVQTARRLTAKALAKESKKRLNLDTWNRMHAFWRNEWTALSSAAHRLFIKPRSHYLTCRMPPMTRGSTTVHLSVALNGEDELRNSSAISFDYCPTPKVTGLDVTAGPRTGAFKIEVCGDNLAAFRASTPVCLRFVAIPDESDAKAKTAVDRVSLVCPVSNVRTKDSGKVHVATISASRFEFVGAHDVQVSATGSPDDFVSTGVRFVSFLPAMLKTVWPNEGPARGGCSIFIRGQDFPATGCIKCRFRFIGSLEAPSADVAAVRESSEMLRVVTPPLPKDSPHGRATIQLAWNGRDFERIGADTEFVYYPDPILERLSPTSGPASDPGTVVVRGLNITGGRGNVRVRFTRGLMVEEVEGVVCGAGVARVRRRANGFVIATNRDAELALSRITKLVFDEEVDALRGIAEEAENVLARGSADHITCKAPSIPVDVEVGQFWAASTVSVDFTLNGGGSWHGPQRLPFRVYTQPQFLSLSCSTASMSGGSVLSLHGSGLDAMLLSPSVRFLRTNDDGRDLIVDGEELGIVDTDKPTPRQRHSTIAVVEDHGAGLRFVTPVFGEDGLGVWMVEASLNGQAFVPTGLHLSVVRPCAEPAHADGRNCVVPMSSPSAGGTPISLYGKFDVNAQLFACFDDGDRTVFVPATSRSGTVLQCITPRWTTTGSSGGSVTVSVTGNRNDMVVFTKDFKMFLPPKLSVMRPSLGVVGGGFDIRFSVDDVSHKGGDAIVVQFLTASHDFVRVSDEKGVQLEDNSQAPPKDFTILSTVPGYIDADARQLVCTAPAVQLAPQVDDTALTVRVSFTGGVQFNSEKFLFTYFRPVELVGTVPSQVMTTGGGELAIRCNHLRNAKVLVRFTSVANEAASLDSKAELSVTVAGKYRGSKRLTCIVPEFPRVGVATVAVSTSGGAEWSNTLSVVFVGRPAVTSINPSYSMVDSRQIIHIGVSNLSITRPPLVKFELVAVDMTDADTVCVRAHVGALAAIRWVLRDTQHRVSRLKLLLSQTDSEDARHVIEDMISELETRGSHRITGMQKRISEIDVPLPRLKRGGVYSVSISTNGLNYSSAAQMLQVYESTMRSHLHPSFGHSGRRTRIEVGGHFADVAPTTVAMHRIGAEEQANVGIPVTDVCVRDSRLSFVVDDGVLAEGEYSVAVKVGNNPPTAVADHFVVLPRPQLLTITPSVISLATDGKKPSISIIGSGFLGPDGNERDVVVRFALSGGGKCESVAGRAVSNTEIRCSCPPFSGGSPLHDSWIVPEVAVNGSTFVGPEEGAKCRIGLMRVDSIEPPRGPREGGSTVQLIGAFPPDLVGESDSDVTVRFACPDDQDLDVVDVGCTHGSRTSLSFTMPPLPVCGRWVVSVAVNQGGFGCPIDFSAYETPHLLQLSPTHVPSCSGHYVYLKVHPMPLCDVLCRFSPISGRGDPIIVKGTITPDQVLPKDILTTSRGTDMRKISESGDSRLPERSMLRARSGGPGASTAASEVQDGTIVKVAVPSPHDTSEREFGVGVSLNSGAHFTREPVRLFLTRLIALEPSLASYCGGAQIVLRATEFVSERGRVPISINLDRTRWSTHHDGSEASKISRLHEKQSELLLRAQTEAAIRIQARERGRRIRHDFDGIRARVAEETDQREQEKAALAIQSAARGRKARKELSTHQAAAEERRRIDAAVRKLQAWMKGCIFRSKLPALVLKMTLAGFLPGVEAEDSEFYKEAMRDEEERAAAARRIQAVQRGRTARREMEVRRIQLEVQRAERAEKRAATRLQSHARGWKVRRRRDEIVKHQTRQKAAVAHCRNLADVCERRIVHLRGLYGTLDVVGGAKGGLYISFYDSVSSELCEIDMSPLQEDDIDFLLRIHPKTAVDDVLNMLDITRAAPDDEEDNLIFTGESHATPLAGSDGHLSIVLRLQAAMTVVGKLIAPDRVRFTVPQLAGPQSARVYVGFGPLACNQQLRFSFVRDLILTDVTPQCGPSTGGTVIRIRGKHIVPTTEAKVRFTSDGVSKTVNARIVDREIEATVPPLKFTPSVPHQVDVDVSLNGSEYSRRIGETVRFTYFAPPRLLFIKPDNACIVGMTELVVKGASLFNGGACTVRFTADDRLPGVHYDVPGRIVNDSTVKCVAPTMKKACNSTVSVSCNGQNFNCIGVTPVFTTWKTFVGPQVKAMQAEMSEQRGEMLAALQQYRKNEEEIKRKKLARKKAAAKAEPEPAPTPKRSPKQSTLKRAPLLSPSKARSKQTALRVEPVPTLAPGQNLPPPTVHVSAQSELESLGLGFGSADSPPLSSPVHLGRIKGAKKHKTEKRKKREPRAAPAALANGFGPHARHATRGGAGERPEASDEEPSVAKKAKKRGKKGSRKKHKQRQKPVAGELKLPSLA